MNFKAKKLPNGKYVVAAIPERKPNGDLVMHVPSYQVIAREISNEKARGGSQ